MSDVPPDTDHRGLDAETLKARLKPALEGLSREDLLELGDFLFEEARRRKPSRDRAWRYPNRVD